MSTISRPARDWHLGDILIPAAGTPRVITMHRLEGAVDAWLDPALTGRATRSQAC